MSNKEFVIKLLHEGRGWLALGLALSHLSVWAVGWHMIRPSWMRKGGSE